MFHSGRTGSTVLADMLNQTNDIFWDGEFYNKMLTNSYPELNFIKNSFTKLKIRSNRAGLNFYGCEVKLISHPHLDNSQISLPDFFNGLKKTGFNYYIILERKNKLRQLVSNAIAIQKGKWHNRKDESSKKEKVFVDFHALTQNKYESFVDFVLHVEETYATLNELLKGEKVLKLTYEDDILNDPFVAYNKVLDFLDVKNRNEISINFKKTNPYLLTDNIINYNELKEMVKNTKYEWMLYE